VLWKCTTSARASRTTSLSRPAAVPFQIVLPSSASRPMPVTASLWTVNRVTAWPCDSSSAASSAKTWSSPPGCW
jgi:hypothetical protein